MGRQRADSSDFKGKNIQLDGACKARTRSAGAIKRPKGRAPKGKAWDHVAGVWEDRVSSVGAVGRLSTSTVGQRRSPTRKQSDTTRETKLFAFLHPPCTRPPTDAHAGATSTNFRPRSRRRASDDTSGDRTELKQSKRRASERKPCQPSRIYRGADVADGGSDSDFPGAGGKLGARGLRKPGRNRFTTERLRPCSIW
jgi:hypothetical protein